MSLSRKVQGAVLMLVGAAGFAWSLIGDAEPFVEGFVRALGVIMAAAGWILLRGKREPDDQQLF